MSDAETTTETPESESGERQPRWALIGIIAAATVLVVLVAVIGFRALLANPSPPLGLTAAADLQLGSCLAESALDLDEYTVVDCASPHPQQVVGTVDMSLRAVDYTEYSAVAVFVAETCLRFVEYSLFVRDDITVEDHQTQALAVPSEEQFTAGTTDALCSLSARDGSELSESLYRPLP